MMTTNANATDAARPTTLTTPGYAAVFPAGTDDYYFLRDSDGAVGTELDPWIFVWEIPRDGEWALAGVAVGEEEDVLTGLLERHAALVVAGEELAAAAAG